MKNRIERKKETKEKGESVISIMQGLSYYQAKDGLYATIYYGNKKKSVKTDSEEYSDYISTKYYQQHDYFPDYSTIRDGLKLIRYTFRECNQDDELFKSRYADCGGEIFINMVNDSFQYLAVDNSGYSIITPEDDTPLFLNDMMESTMVEPSGKDVDAINLLDDLLNLNEDDKFFLKIWIIAAMNPTIRIPILYFLGSAGSGKTSIQNFLRDLIDPTKRGAVNWDGTSDKELSIALNNSYLINYDNVSKIDRRKSDLLCQSTTGGKKAYRKLYTDSDEIVYDLQARVTISSVRNCIVASDLAERIYLMNVPNIKHKKRIPENEYHRIYQERLPKIFGGLLTVLSMGLNEFDEWKQNNEATYRLADFELFGGLIAHLLDEDTGYERFNQILKRNQRLQARMFEEKQPYFDAMLEMLDERARPFDGKMAELYDLINDWISEAPQYEGEVENIILRYSVFTKAIHFYAETLSSLGYNLSFYKTPENCSAVKIEKLEN